MKLLELHCCTIPLTTARGGGILAVLAGAVAGPDLGTQESDVDVPLTGGPQGAAHPSDSCVMEFVAIAADLESHLAVVSKVPAEAIGFSPDGRLPLSPSLAQAVAWDEVEESCALSTPGSADEGHARLSSPVA